MLNVFVSQPSLDRPSVVPVVGDQRCRTEKAKFVHGSLHLCRYQPPWRHLGASNGEPGMTWAIFMRRARRASVSALRANSKQQSSNASNCSRKVVLIIAKQRRRFAVPAEARSGQTSTRLRGRSVKFGIGRTEDVRRRFRVVCLKGDAGRGQQASGYSCGMQTPRR
jgi:hypothetical protein